ncbi:MAG: divalent-cation tolerance protein CutA [bacterium]|jgi:periplasmic divalent cation tolerance protein|nr:divalent-cation tolerance protein CutA [Betaproteobacteria bacterium]
MAARDILLVMTTLPDAAVAATIARALVERRLAACASVQSGCRSVYRWQGAVEQATEVPLLVKTTAARYPALEAALREMHPYELPEIVALSVADGLPAYLEWIISGTIDEDGLRNDDDR